MIHTGEKMGQEIEGKEKVRDALLVRPLMAPDPSTQHAKVTCGAPAASRRHSVSFIAPRVVGGEPEAGSLRPASSLDNMKTPRPGV